MGKLQENETAEEREGNALSSYTRESQLKEKNQLKILLSFIYVAL